MNLIRFYKNEREGGPCANCGRDTRAYNKQIWLCEIEPGLVEPCSLCKVCIEHNTR